MTVLLRINNTTKHGLLYGLRSQFNSQRLNSTKAKGAVQAELSPDYSACRDLFDISKWKKLDARKLGITDSMIPLPSWTVLNLLRKKGFNTYLVGGCVRDLLLNRIPKDFDVITTAKLIEVRRHFRHVARVDIVGRRFPICRVHIRGSVVEVSSFKTVRENAEKKEHFLYSIMPRGCKKIDLILCEDSLHRDFTINSLFFDPFVNTIYDYATGTTDLRSMKLQTVIPAQLSLKEDPGRILRGVRIAARLGLSLSREIDAAIRSFSSLVKSLDKTRIMLELNYMLSYGAAEPSLHLLWKFNLLEIFFPLHAAYLDQQAEKQDAQTSMLMKLFFHLDKLTASNRPSNCTIWVGLLAFHLALVKKPQDALVLCAFASVLYYGQWEKGIKFAKEHAEMNVNYVPELRRFCIYKSDIEIAKAVSELAVLARNSIPALVEKDILIQSMSRFPSLTCSGMVYVPRKTGKSVAQIFEVLVNDIISYRSKKESFEINYDELGRGDLSEARFVLGKVVLETLSSGVVDDKEVFETKKRDPMIEGTEETCQPQSSDPVNHQPVAKKKKTSSNLDAEHKQKKIKAQKLVENRCILEPKIGSKKVGGKLVRLLRLPKKKNFHQRQLRQTAVICENTLDQSTLLNIFESKTCMPVQCTAPKNHQEIVEILGNSNIYVDAETTKESVLKKKILHSSPDEVFKEKEKEGLLKRKQSQPSLSSLFK